MQYFILRNPHISIDIYDTNGINKPNSFISYAISKIGYLYNKLTFNNIIDNDVFEEYSDSDESDFEDNQDREFKHWCAEYIDEDDSPV